MSGIKDTSTITLNVNGTQAKRMLADIEQQLTSARQKLDALKQSGADTKAVEKQRKEVKNLEKQFNEAQSAIVGVNKALKNLDSATPRELEKSLRTLKRELKDMPQGSATWNSQIQKIKEVESQLRLIRSQMQDQKSTWDKFCGWMNNSFAAIGTLVLGASQAIQTLKGYVADFASMDAEMANVRKFTGMSAKEVEELNEQLKKMDTRTSREDLNKLAQEAGRLGKQSIEDVLGFVKAADKINVALDDLGAGATLTLSKLTGIFGIESQYGTEKSLLKVGSIINELSQNCSASAPFIAEFSSRLGGVAAQAKMSISQVMAFGAVLDTQQMNVEASSSAISQLISKMYKDPSKFAQAAQIDVKQFSDLVKRDMNAALIMLFENLNKYGGMSNLAKVFADMGTDGIRLQQVMAALVGHVDELKNQEIEANKAFSEGISIDKEFSVQNNTVQASLDKAKKSLQEVTIQLGERLQPLMSHVMSSTSALARSLLVLINYLEENKVMVATAAIAVAGWTVALNANIIAQKLWAVCVKTSSVMAATVRGGSLALSVVFNALTGRITRATAAMRLLNTTLKGSLWGIFATAATFAIGKLVEYHEKTEEAAAKQAKLNREHEAYVKGLRNINAKSTEYSQKELSRLDALYRAATNEANSKERRIAAAQRLQNLYPNYFKSLSTEAIMVGNAKSKYDDLTSSIVKAANARAAQDKIAEIGGQMLDEQTRTRRLETRKGQVGAVEQKLLTDIAAAQEKRNNAASTDGSQTNEWKKWNKEVLRLQNLLDGVRERLGRINTGLKDSAGKIKTATDAQEYLAKEYGVDINAAVAGDDNRVPTAETPTIDDYTSKKTLAAEARKAATEAKRAQMKAKKEFTDALDEAKARYAEGEAANVVAYGQGTKKYQEYTDEKSRLDLEYVNRRIQIYDDLYKAETPQNQRLLKEYDDEYQQFLLQKAELENKADDDRRGKSVKDLQEKYNKEVAAVNLKSVSPNEGYYSDATAKEEELFRLKQEYLKLYAKCYEEGSQERIGYEKQIEQNEQEHMLKLKQDYAQKYKDWFDKYDSQSLDYRKSSELAVLESLYTDKLITVEQREQQRLEIIEKYAKLRAEAERSQSDEELAEKYQFDGPNGDTFDARSGQQRIDSAASQRKRDKDFALNMLGMRVSAGLISDEEADEIRKRIERIYDEELFNEIGSSLDSTTKMFYDLGTTIAEIGNMSWDNLVDSLKNIGDIAQTTFAVMGSSLETYSQFASAQTEIDINRTEKQYSRKIELAQGNSYKVSKLEKEKEEKIEKLQKEGTRREYTIKIATAIADTAQNAVKAYGAGLEAGFPMALWLAPMLAGIATATGLAQVALIKKQQTAAESGYAEGGFTKPGGKYEPAGIVHAGEWVASQELLASPVARPLIDALDYAQRTNTIGSLNADDVSRSITAPSAISMLAEQDSSSAIAIAALAQNSNAVNSLVTRLNEPFVTVNTVSGDMGIKKAQDDYDQLIRNKTPKSRRK